MSQERNNYSYFHSPGIWICWWSKGSSAFICIRKGFTVFVNTLIWVYFPWGNNFGSCKVWITLRSWSAAHHPWIFGQGGWGLWFANSHCTTNDLSRREKCDLSCRYNSGWTLWGDEWNTYRTDEWHPNPPNRVKIENWAKHKQNMYVRKPLYYNLHLKMLLFLNLRH